MPLAIKREITTTRYFDDLISELMRRRNISRSEAYRHVQLEAAGRTAARIHAGQLVAAIKNEARAVDRESSGRHNARVQLILRSAADLLAVI